MKNTPATPPPRYSSRAAAIAQAILSSAADLSGHKKALSKEALVLSWPLAELAALVHWLLEERVTYAVAKVRAKERFGRNISVSCLSDLWRQRITPRMIMEATGRAIDGTIRITVEPSALGEPPLVTVTSAAPIILKNNTPPRGI